MDERNDIREIRLIVESQNETIQRLLAVCFKQYVPPADKVEADREIILEKLRQDKTAPEPLKPPKEPEDEEIAGDLGFKD